jgi:predicted nucleic acid-binding protein
VVDDPVSKSPVFFDTNILLYLFDRRSKEKRHVAGELFKKYQQGGSLRLSLQVVHEFAANLLSRKFGVPRATVADVVGDLLALDVVTLRGEDTLTALHFVGEFAIGFWDALILASATREGCKVLYSEDFQHGRVYGTVRVINPFEGDS